VHSIPKIDIGQRSTGRAQISHKPDRVVQPAWTAVEGLMQKL
jgi:hypothetical protein